MYVLDSGMVIDWSHANFDGPIVDKHSTGGVGDVTSLMLGLWWQHVAVSFQWFLVVV